MPPRSRSLFEVKDEIRVLYLFAPELYYYFADLCLPSHHETLRRAEELCHSLWDLNFGKRGHPCYGHISSLI